MIYLPIYLPSNNRWRRPDVVPSASKHNYRAAITLRQQRAMSLGDALIAATALNLYLPLATHNTDDFTWIKSLTVVDPMQA
jgi:hypothetical protein